MKYGLIGEKLGHSFSKPIHEKIAGYKYEIKELKRDELDSFMLEKSFSGINVTIPYKSEVIPYLDYIDPVAEKIGAVNTVVNKNGRLYGYNTDFGGLKMLIQKSGFSFKERKVVILGTGGTSKTARAVAEALSAAEIVIVGRKGDVNYENIHSLHGDADYIINTTPVGMYPDCDSAAVDVKRFSKLKGIVDVVYNPLKTLLCLEGEEMGIKSVNGLYMLVCQAVLACEYFTDKKLDTKAIADEIFSEIVREKQSIVLIGMPGSGKSTIGKHLAKVLGKEFIDTDDMIVSEHGAISDIFAEKGEAYFREVEAEQVRKAAMLNGTVIATGGGAVLKRENVTALKQNGIIFFLNRPIEDIVPTDDRPLSNNFETLKKRFEERYDIYVSSAEEEIFVDGIIENSVKKIMEKLK